MDWKPIVVAVDGTAESAAAAALGCRLAAAAGTRCHLVHAVRDPGDAFAAVVLERGATSVEPILAELVGPRLRAALGGMVPAPALDALAFRVGRPAAVLRAEVDRVGAGLAMVGGKRHVALGRWLGGSTAHDAVRLLPVPVLVTREPPVALRRVLVAVDLSYAAEPTIREAERFATLAGGTLRAVHVVDRGADIQDVAWPVSQEQFEAYSAGILESDIWPLLRLSGAERVVRTGEAGATLAAEAAEWRADVLVVGSHGKGWVDRLLLGSVTQRLLNGLPASLLVVPVRKPELLEAAPAEAATARAGAGRL